MSMLDERPRTLPDAAAPAGGEIVAMAAALTTEADRDPDQGHLVVVARTATGEYAATGASGGPLRAAVSVVVAAGNSRLWNDVSGTETTEVPVRALPEIVRSAAEAQGVTSVHVGAAIDTELAALAVWFEVAGSVASGPRRRETMELLATAAERQRESLASRRAAEAAAQAAAGPRDDAGACSATGRGFDPTDPNLDADTGLATRERFEKVLEEYDSDEATLIVVDIDGFAAVADACGTPVANQIVREVADRLVGSCRKDDVIARLGPDAFAILFADAPRAVGLQVAKRLVETIAAPLDIDGAPDHVTATVALAHQFGLLDMDELMESADDAVASGKRAGAGRLVIAS